MIRLRSPSSIEARTFSTEDGEFFIALDRTAGDRLIECGWTAMRALPDTWTIAARLSPTLVERIRQAIAGHASDFADVRLPETSAFFDACRRAAQGITTGTTITYGELASRAGSPAAARAAGQAMRRNPVPIVVPCHRVIAASGAIGGFSGAWSGGWGEEGGSTGLKARLLAREARRAGTRQPQRAEPRHSSPFLDRGTSCAPRRMSEPCDRRLR